MGTEALRISLAQRILGIMDDSILKKIDLLLNQKNIIGYDTTGNPVTEDEYISDLNRINNEIDNGTAKLFSTEEVRKSIINENNLA